MLFKKGEQLVTVAADITQTIAKGLNTVSTFISEKTNKSIDLASPFKKTGAYKSVVNHFGEGELADDLYVFSSLIIQYFSVGFVTVYLY